MSKSLASLRVDSQKTYTILIQRIPVELLINSGFFRPSIGFVWLGFIS